MEQHDVVSSALRAGAWMRRAGWQVARRLPGARLAEREMRRIEDAILDEVRRLLEGRTAPGSTSYAEGPGANGDASLRDGMAALLARSIESDRAASEEELHATILRQLVPDEARILAALSDGSAYPVIDVVTRDRTLLRNASTVGRAAGVTVLDNVPAYLDRLLQLGLVELAAPDSTMSTQYDILATDQLVQQASVVVGQHRRDRARQVRRTVRMSALGNRFWQACGP